MATANIDVNILFDITSFCAESLKILNRVTGDVTDGKRIGLETCKYCDSGLDATRKTVVSAPHLSRKK